MFAADDDIDDSLSRTSCFLCVNELDNAFKAAENDDEYIDKDEFVDNWGYTVEGVKAMDATQPPTH